MTAVAKVRPREHRAKTLKPDMARTSRLAREVAEISQRDLADSLDVQQPFIAKWELADEAHAPTVLHVASGPIDWAQAMVRWQAAQQQLQVYQEAPIVHGDNTAERLAALSAETTDPVRALSRASADGRFTITELEHLARECRECVEASRECESWAVREIERQRAERDERNRR